MIALAVWAVAFSLLAAASATDEEPTVVLTVDDSMPVVGQIVHFNATASQVHEEGSGRNFVYRFQFGDGTGTDWQSSQTVAHAYAQKGNFTASVTVRNRQGEKASASLRIVVSSPPPPVPDLTPVLAMTGPQTPTEGGLVNLTVFLLNRGSEAARNATVDAQDVRPNGTVGSLGRASMPRPLEPGGVEAVNFAPFRAVGVGNHTLRLTVLDVQPPEVATQDNLLNATMVVAPANPNPIPESPDLVPLAATADPPRPVIWALVNLTVVVLNRGGVQANAATLHIYDDRPDGTVEFLGAAPLPAALPPGEAETVVFGPFQLETAGNHTLRIVVADVMPPPGSPLGHELTLALVVSGTTPPSRAGGGAVQPTPLVFVLAAASVASVLGAAYFLLRRPSPTSVLEPPSAEPPDRSPPPLWPP